MRPSSRHRQGFYRQGYPVCRIYTVFHCEKTQNRWNVVIAGDQTHGRFFHLVKLSKKTPRQRAFKESCTMFKIFFVIFHKKAIFYGWHAFCIMFFWHKIHGYQILPKSVTQGLAVPEGQGQKKKITEKSCIYTIFSLWTPLFGRMRDFYAMPLL